MTNSLGIKINIPSQEQLKNIGGIQRGHSNPYTEMVIDLERIDYEDYKDYIARLEDNMVITLTPDDLTIMFDTQNLKRSYRDPLETSDYRAPRKIQVFPGVAT